MNRILFVGFLWFGFASTALAAREGALDPNHVQFLKDTSAILTTAERELFGTLTQSSARELFIEMFWKARDPTPGTDRNEGREDHYKRLAFVRQRLEDDTPRDGALTDRGKTYLRLGEPIRIERYPSNRAFYPMELWFYSSQGNPKLPPYFYMLFFRPHETEEYKLYIPGIQNPGDLTASDANRRLEPVKAHDKLREIDVELAYASVSSDATRKSGKYNFENTTTFSTTVAAAVEQIPNDTVDTSYVRRFRADGTVDAEPTFEFVDMDWTSRAFLHEDGQMHLHYGLQLLPRNLGVGQHKERTYASLLLAGSIGRSGQGDETFVDLQDGVEINLTAEQYLELRTLPFAYLSRHILLPGRYDLRMLLRNNTSQQAARVEEAVVVPDPAAKSPTLTLPLLISGKELESKRADGLEKPFQVGELRLVPKVRREVFPEEAIQVYSQLLPGSAGVKSAEWTSRLELMRDEKVLVTENLALNTTPTGPSGTRHVLYSLSAKGLPLGTYQIRLSLFDAAGKPLTTTSSSMVLTLDAASTPWQSAKRRPGPGSDPVRLDQARQLLQAGRTSEAADLLGPLASRSQYTEGALSGFDWQVCITMAEIARQQKNLKSAALYLERALAGAPPTPQLYVDLGRVRMELGEKEKARQAWQRALELEPDQPQLAKELEALQP